MEDAKIAKKLLRLFSVALILVTIFTNSAAASWTYEVDGEQTSGLAAYQEVLDRLNNEYGSFMTFAEDDFDDGISFSDPRDLTAEEFEEQIRTEYESSVAVNNAGLAAKAALGDVEWTELPYLGKHYVVPVNSTYADALSVNNIYQDTVDFQQSREAGDTVSAQSSTQTITSVQARKDPTGNVAFLITSNIDILTNWTYSSVISFSYSHLRTTGARYIPTTVSYSVIDSSRTIAATFTCDYYGQNGTLVNSGVTVYIEYSTTGDCYTNWPNYTISPTVTNKTYNLIASEDDSQNCAGYAWNYDGYVSMSELGITYAELNNCSSLTDLRTLVKNKSESYMSSHGIRASVIGAYNSTINTSTQYRVVMRVGYYDTNGNGEWDFGYSADSDMWDYHWWMQLGDGSWADKRGSFPSRIVTLSNIYTNPEAIIWRWDLSDYGETVYANFYSSTPVYYKVTG